MTREKIIQGLYKGDSRAIKEAIKVLEQETCEEKTKTKSIPLDRAIREIQKLRGCSCSCSDGIIDDVEDILDKLIESE